MRRRAIFLALLFPGLILAGALPYDEAADAKSEIRQALADAARSQLPVLIVFGANWCQDCRALDTALKQGRNADLMARSFRVVKVDVGKFDRNLDVSAAYGNPIKKGIPAAVIVSANNRVLYATRAGELADARSMSEDGIHEFFRQAASAGH